MSGEADMSERDLRERIADLEAVQEGRLERAKDLLREGARRERARILAEVERRRADWGRWPTPVVALTDLILWLREEGEDAS